MCFCWVGSNCPPLGCLPLVQELQKAACLGVLQAALLGFYAHVAPHCTSCRSRATSGLLMMKCSQGGGWPMRVEPLRGRAHKLKTTTPAGIIFHSSCIALGLPGEAAAVPLEAEAFMSKGGRNAAAGGACFRRDGANSSTLSASTSEPQHLSKWPIVTRAEHSEAGNSLEKGPCGSPPPCAGPRAINQHHQYVACSKRQEQVTTRASGMAEAYDD